MMKAISVSEINEQIKEIIEGDPRFASVLIEGEISNYKLNGASGHLYFTLKDDKSVIKAVMFRGYATKLNFEPRDGMKVQVLAKLTVYTPGGSYQLQALAMKQAGLGDLYERMEELKSKLAKEGLFDSDKKQKIPFMPKTIGVITSKTGAVIRDIINVSTRRNPNVNIKLYPVSVQGDKSAEEIAEAVKYMNENQVADVLIVGRGGGSIEDLWSFNEEIVVRAIAESKIPVISAVGHETDWTLTDYVSDLRAPTPSAAAELAVKDVSELKEKILEYKKYLTNKILEKVKYARISLENDRRKLKDPTQIINEARLKIDKNIDILYKEIVNHLKVNRSLVEKFNIKLKAYNVFNTLDRGYALIIKDGKYVSDDSEIKKGDKIDIRFKKEIRKATIDE